MTQKSFGAQIDAWVRKTQQRQELVFKEATQTVVNAMQQTVGEGGNMPVDTGTLRASAQASTSGPPPIRNDLKAIKGESVTYNPDQIALIIAGATLGQSIWVTYGANYAAAVEYGSRGRAGRGFVRLAAQQWPKIVNATIAEAKARVR